MHSQDTPLTLTPGAVYTYAQAVHAVGCTTRQGFFAYRRGEPPRAIFPKLERNPFAHQGRIAIHGDPKDHRGAGPLLERWLGDLLPVHLYWEARDAPLPQHVFWGVAPRRWEYAGVWRPTRVCQKGEPEFAGLDAAYRKLAPGDPAHFFVEMAQEAATAPPLP
jgi:hypothetical protein